MNTSGKIGVTTENIFPIIKKFLYSDHEIFLRELVSNAVDATTKIKALSSLGELKTDIGTLAVKVSLDTTTKTLTISDNGIGMTEQEIEKYINQIAFSGAEEFMAKYENQTGIIGHFGLGFYSAFMVASKVEIITKSYQDGAQAIRWECDGTPNYTIEPSQKTERGTDIILHISDDSAEFAAKERIETLLKKYCAFLPVAIEFEGKQINDTTPLWTLKPSDVTDQQYNDFYRKLYPFAEEPLFHIHLNVDYPFNLTGILYFPRISNNFEVQKNKIQLYCNQVFVTDSVEGIVPEFLTLLHGVLDSPDIPLNVSRSYLQSDSNVKKISSHITKKVADRLAEIFKETRTDYQTKWDDLKLFIQYGIVSDEKFGERAAEFTLLKNSQGKYFTFDEYNTLIKGNQTDKNGKIVHLYANDAVAQHSFIDAAQAKGYDVLVMDSPLEAHFISFLENKNTDWSFVRVDSAPVDKLIDKESKLAMSLTNAQQQLLTPVFEAVLPQNNGAHYNIEFAAMEVDDVPAIITQNEFMRRMKDMSKMGGQGMNFYGQMPDSYNMVLNGNHPLVAEVLGQVVAKTADELPELDDKLNKLRAAQEKDKENKETTDEITKVEASRRELLTKAGTHNVIAAQVVDLAMLAAGLLKGEKLTAFVRRSVNLIK